MAKFLGIDVGTSGCKLLLIDETGRVLKQASAEYPLSTPRPLWSEQDPEDWWAGVERCLAEIGETPDAIGVTGQMHGAVFLDADDRVVRPAILWNDQRTAAECAEIDARVGPERFRQITRNPPLTGFQLPKVLWLRNHEPEAYARVRSVLLPKDYIRFRLTGVKAAEVSDASGTAAFDTVQRQWSTEVLEAVDVPRAFFPDVSESFQVTAKTRDGVPVAGGGGDQAAAAVGTGAVEPGIVSVSLGTSGVVFTALDEPGYDPAGAAHTFCHANGAWHAMSVMLSCGGALRWYRDTLGANRSYAELADLAEQAPIGSDGLTFLPYLSGERSPHNDPWARAAFAGLTLAHGPGSVARAVFEGMSFGLLDGMNLLKGLGARVDLIRVTSGGAKSRFWVQMLADLFGAPCSLLECDEGPAFGAALLGGVAIGAWPDVATACRSVVKQRETFSPTGADYSQPYARYRSLYPAISPWNPSRT